MAYNVFKRPMFKRGGSTTGTGIMSHVESKKIGGGTISGNNMPNNRTGFQNPLYGLISEGMANELSRGAYKSPGQYNIDAGARARQNLLSNIQRYGKKGLEFLRGAGQRSAGFFGLNRIPVPPGVTSAATSTATMAAPFAPVGILAYLNRPKTDAALEVMRSEPSSTFDETGAFEATGIGTLNGIVNTNSYTDSSGDTGTAGQILSSTGASGTNWIDDPNPTPYSWLVEADSGSGSPYTVANGDTIDFVGVGNVDTAWDNSSKELRISLGGTSISGTGADTQVVYWTGAQTVAGDAGMLYNATSNNLTVTGTVQAGTFSDGTFSGTAGTYTGGVSITSTTFVGALTGNASTATQLASSGAIALTGDTTSTGGPYTYTSGGAINISTTIADTTVTGKVLTNLPTPASSVINASDTILAAMAKLQDYPTTAQRGFSAAN